MKQRFRVEDNKVIHTSWEDNEDQTEIYSEEKWKKMLDWVYEILVPEDNRVLLPRLIVTVPKKEGLFVD